MKEFTLRKMLDDGTFVEDIKMTIGDNDVLILEVGTDENGTPLMPFSKMAEVAKMLKKCLAGDLEFMILPDSIKFKILTKG